MRERVTGPLDGSVLILLLDGVHSLAENLGPKVFNAHAPDVAGEVDRAFHVVMVYFVRSPQVFSPLQPERLSEEERIFLLRGQLTMYAAAASRP